MKRFKKWITILPILAVTVILGLSPVAAMAADEDVAVANPDYPYAGSLDIVAPRIAMEDQRISMRVFLRWNQEPFEGAGVWAFTRDQAEIMKEEVRKLAEDQSTPVEKKDYEALASVHGTFIGTTGSDGRVYYSFENKGNYLLAAVKRGYYPGFTTIRIGSMPKAMVLDAPPKARVNETITTTVTQRGTGTPIENAGIWAFTKERAEELPPRSTLSEKVLISRSKTSIMSDSPTFTVNTLDGQTNAVNSIMHSPMRVVICCSRSSVDISRAGLASGSVKPSERWLSKPRSVPSLERKLP